MGLPVKTNNIGLSHCIESSPGVASQNWVRDVVNNISTYGATTTLTRRQPISPSRQIKKRSNH